MSKSETFTFEDREYPVFTKVTKDGKLEYIKGTVLKCPTCPNVAQFKDIPHLLAHYGSRDHLKAANELKIRHDCNIAQSIRVWKLYQLWQEKNQVWRWLVEAYQRKEEKSAKARGDYL